MNSRDDVAKNLQQASTWIAESAQSGAELIALPEAFAFMRREGEAVPVGQGLDGPIVSALRDEATRHGVWILGGSFPEAIPDDPRVYNTSVVIDAGGEIAAVYRKIHLFDVDLRKSGGQRYCESERYAAGGEIAVAKTPFGVVGLSVCYDLRFPELYRAHADAGARFIAVPSAFARETGRDHWEVLLRARAIENQVFVLAAAQCGDHGGGRASYGRSMIIDPWGLVLARAPDAPGPIYADCRFEEQDRIREAIPALGHRQLRMRVEP